jgi:hypothetical protein
MGELKLHITEVKPVQLLKALGPMNVTEFPMVTEFKPIQSRKAIIPMIVTELGIVIEVKLEQL